jgi:hypothetical protein
LVEAAALVVADEAAPVQALLAVREHPVKVMLVGLELL